MRQGTGRFMCLSCGRFISMEYPIEPGFTICPFCGDMFFCDNILLDVPPYMNVTTVKGECEHEFQADFVGDVQFCPICQSSIPNLSGLKMKEWQESIIREVL